MTEPGRLVYLLLTNRSDQEVIIQRVIPFGQWMQADMIPRTPGYVSVGSRRYQEWQTLEFEQTTEEEENVFPEGDGPLVETHHIQLQRKF